MSTTSANRKINAGLAFLCGLVVGVICYLLAEWLTPKQVASPGDHDILSANRLGFIYTPVVALWLGWLQRSWRRAGVGALIGAVIGFVYMWLCASRNFLAIMVGFPCLLGGGLAAVVGSNRSPWLAGLGARLGKGLFAGLVLGFVYMVVLNLGGGMMMTPSDVSDGFTRGGINISTNDVPSACGADNTDEDTRAYIRMMWRDGPVALGISSALFFVLMRWAVGLTRVRLFVFEEVEAQKTEHDHTA